mmetsp:Transcript_22993/g.57620  ORF Transcript_22993/g.57620 Transcript_22993/m.57620 type:complete len:303 (-) Transcript_22993:986-1894(-)
MGTLVSAVQSARATPISLRLNFLQQNVVFKAFLLEALCGLVVHALALHQLDVLLVELIARFLLVLELLLDLDQVGIHTLKNLTKRLKKFFLVLPAAHGGGVFVVHRVEDRHLAGQQIARVLQRVVRAVVLARLHELGMHLLVQLNKHALVLLQLCARRNLIHLALNHLNVPHFFGSDLFHARELLNVPLVRFLYDLHAGEVLVFRLFVFQLFRLSLQLHQLSLAIGTERSLLALQLLVLGEKVPQLFEVLLVLGGFGVVEFLDFCGQGGHAFHVCFKHHQFVLNDALQVVVVAADFLGFLFE